MITTIDHKSLVENFPKADKIEYWVKLHFANSHETLIYGRQVTVYAHSAIEALALAMDGIDLIVDKIEIKQREFYPLLAP